MNTERRHELGENVLARELNTWGEKLRPYTSALLAVIAALLGVYIVASMWNSYQERRDRAAWDDYQLAVFAGDVEQRTLQRLANNEDHAGTDMQEWALMAWADRQLLRASQLYLSNRTEANERVTEVMGTYELFAESGSHPEIRNRARLGLARAYEMKNDLKEARAQYLLVEGSLAEIAKERAKDLEAKEVEETAKWLATTDLPKPAPATGPGTPGSRPGFEATTPSADPAGASPSASTMEEILGALGKADDAARYDAPAAETPAASEPAAEPADAATPPAETPAADAPAAEPAATNATPADTPAETPVEQPAAADAAAKQ